MLQTCCQGRAGRGREGGTESSTKSLGRACTGAKLSQSINKPFDNPSAALRSLFLSSLWTLLAYAVLSTVCVAVTARRCAHR